MAVCLTRSSGQSSECARDVTRNWPVLKNGDRVIGLLQRMFSKNVLTFNPGRDQNAQKFASFTVIRELQRPPGARALGTHRFPG